jgi:hypothetical protein
VVVVVARSAERTEHRVPSQRSAGARTDGEEEEEEEEEVVRRRRKGGGWKSKG